MAKFQFFVFMLLVFLMGCNEPSHQVSSSETEPVKGALLTKRFTSFEEFKSKVQVEYIEVMQGSIFGMEKKPQVRITYVNNGQQVSSVLQSGIDQSDFVKARDGSLLDKIWLGLRSPYAAINRKNLKSVFVLARRRQNMYGWGDAAFYDLSEIIYCNMSAEESATMQQQDLTEKGYFNTINHISGQAFMTTLFTEELADFIADVHERHSLPELVTGAFSEKQLNDIDNGPVDNYVDLINNEWGQEVGKALKEKYHINRKTQWTPQLLADYLNDLQHYFSWAFKIRFDPCKASDEVIIRFATKINTVMRDIAG